MVKRFLSLGLAILMVLSLAVLPVSAADATEKVEFSFAWNAAAPAEGTEAPYGYFSGQNDGSFANQNLSNNQYRTYTIVVGEAGDYTLRLKCQPFHLGSVEIMIDGVFRGDYKLDRCTGHSYTQIIDTYGLSAGEHTLRVTCKNATNYLYELTLTKVGEGTENAYIYRLDTASGKVVDLGVDNNPVYGSYPGNYDEVYDKGWIQYLLPENYGAGMYTLGLRYAGSNVSTVTAYLGSALATSNTVVGAKVGEGTATPIAYGTFKKEPVAVIYLNGTDRYLTVQFSKGTRFTELYLTRGEVTSEYVYSPTVRSLTNPGGNNNNGKPDWGCGATENLKYAIDVRDAGQYRLKATMTLNTGETSSGTVTASLNEKAVASAEITSIDWNGKKEEDFGIITLPKGVSELSFKGNCNTSWRFYSFSLERVKVGEEVPFVLTNVNTNYTSVNPVSGFSNYSVLNGSNWAAYQIPVAVAGTYKVTASTATNSTTSKMELSIFNSHYGVGENHVSCGEVPVPNSGFTNFVNDVAWCVELDEGINPLMFTVWGAAARFNQITITPVKATTVTNSAAETVTNIKNLTEETLTVTGPKNEVGVTMIAALYENGKLVQADVADVVDVPAATAEDEAYQNLVATLSDVTTAATGSELRVFYWNNLEGATPVVDSYVIQ